MLIRFLLLLVVVSAIPIDLTQSLKFQIISSNVRTDTKFRFYHEHRWAERKQDLINQLYECLQKLPTLIGLQELKHNQVRDLINGLNNKTQADHEDLTNTYGAPIQELNRKWQYYGVGRDNGHKKGEYAPIVYESDKWELLNGTTKWLSTTPDVPSKSWSAANIRIVTITTFKNKQTGVVINMLNTHYDHMSEQARGESSLLIMNYISQIPNNHETFLLGDFNSLSTDASYQTLIKDLLDTRDSAMIKKSDMKTYTGFEPQDAHTVIDFIWCSKNNNKPDAKTYVNSYDVMDTWTEQGFRYSDHRPVIVGLEVKL